MHCNGALVSGVTMPSVVLTNDTIVPHIDPADGCWLYEGLPAGGNYSITPEKDGDDLNGVSMFDIIQGERHILGLEPLNTPYRIIAADVSKSNSITTFDLVASRRLIQGIYTEFPTNTSWRLIDAGIPIPTPQNPFQGAIVETIDLNGIQQDTTIYYYGIKVGDTNCDAFPGFSGGADDRRQVALSMPDVELETGQTIDLPLRLNEAGDWLGVQMDLQYDSQVLEIESVHSPVFPDTDGSAVVYPKAGAVNMTWYDVLPHSISNGDPLAVLRLHALAPVRTRNAISLNTSRIRPEIYSATEDVDQLQLFFTEERQISGTGGGMNAIVSPNPVVSDARILLSLDMPETVSVTLRDLAGRQCWSARRGLDAGTHALEIPSYAFPAAGVYLWQIETGNGLVSGKLVKN
ncbi:MAG: T9SS type A sorting domain-containing protein [Saprospiraceae bacterium]